MKVNLIGNFQPNTGLNHDASIMRGLLTHVYGKDVQIFKVPHVFPQCEESDINIFLEVINPSLFAYANKNIWIPNQEWTYKTWIPYLKMVDEVWTKTKQATQIFTDLGANVREVGWTSIDKVFCEKKIYSKAIVLVGKNIYRQPKQLLKAYLEIQEKEPDVYEKLPHLYIPYNPNHVTFYYPFELASKVTLLRDELTEKEYDELLQECGLAICLSAAEGYGHAVNEAMSSGCNMILSSIQPFEQLAGGNSSALFTDVLTVVDHPDCLAKLVDTTIPSIVLALKTYIKRDFKSKKNAGAFMRSLYEKRHKSFLNDMKNALESIRSEGYSLSFPKEEELPDVSIVTITKDRRVFMPLAKYSYMIQSYPESKLEWVIVDDGDDPIEDTLFGVPNVTYIRCEKSMTIGEKRNLGVEKAIYNTIVMMDDDDVYPNNSVLHRVAMMLKEPVKQCGFCTTIPCYDIKKFCSFMNVPPMTLSMSERVSEATLVFTRAFWEERKFDDIQIAEGNTFIHGREQVCRELSPQDVIVSLVHSKNTSSRKIPEFKEANGCHYGFNEQLFSMVTQIGETI